MPFKLNPVTGSLDLVSGTSGSGDVAGPSSATDNAVARFDGTTGKIIQNSSVIIADDGSVDTAGRVFVDGSADTTQLLVQGHSTQTSLLAVFENSSGADQVTISGIGAAVFNEQGNDADFRVEGDTDASLIFADASADRVGIGTSSPGTKLDVSGALRLSGTSQDTYVTPLSSNIATKINIPNFNPGDFGQIMAIGLPSTASTTSRAISILDARTGSHQPTLAVFTPNENNMIGFSWDGSNTEAKVKSTGSTDIVLANGNGTLFAVYNSTGTFTTPLSTGINVKFNIPVVDPGNFGQIMAMGIPAAASSSSRALTLFDARTSAHQPTLSMFTPDENNYGGFSWDGSNTDLAFKNNSSSGSLSFRLGAIGSSVDQLILKAGEAVFNEVGGNVDFRVEGDTDASLIFADASADRVGIGTSSPGVKLDITGSLRAEITGSATTAAVRAIVDTVVATNQALHASNDTNFAHAGAIALFEALNATDTGEVVLINNAGSGLSLKYQARGAGQAGTSTAYAKIGGSIQVNTTAVGNVGSGEDDLMTYSVPANTLSSNQDSLEFKAAGTIANNVNSKRIRVKFGATTIFDTGAAGIPVSNAIDWIVEGKVIRTGATTQKCLVTMNTNNATLASYADYAAAAETLSGAVTLKLTGEATSDNDIVQEVMSIEWTSAP